jgi:hypothetical protein
MEKVTLDGSIYIPLIQQALERWKKDNKDTELIKLTVSMMIVDILEKEGVHPDER